MELGNTKQMYNDVQANSLDQTIVLSAFKAIILHQ